MRLNYKHLQYFHVLAREGSLLRASERLNLTPQTISGQLKVFEESVGEALFRKAGRRLELTEAGRFVLEYAEDIFNLGRELEDALQLGLARRPREFRVGVADVIPKSIAFKFLAPAMRPDQSWRLICHEHDLTRLLGGLAVHEIDMVIADIPMPPAMNVRCYNHRLGSSDLEFFAAPSLADRLHGPFPKCLHGVPMLLPGQAAAVRQGVVDWLAGQDVQPLIVGEFDDTALLKAFGAQGTGVFFVATVIADEVREQYQVASLGRTSEVRQDYYAITVERRITHPAIRAVTDKARDLLTTGI